jgi:flagellar assembly protein FliH
MTGHAKSTSKRYNFDTVFARDGSDGGVSPPPANAKKVYTQAEIDKLTGEARNEGMHAGQVRALEALGHAAGHAASLLQQALAQSHHEIEKVREEACKFAIAIARKLASEAIAHLPATDVEHALRQAMHQAIGEPRIVLKASPAVIEALAPHTEAIAHEEGFEGRLIVHAEPHLKGADCRIEWRGGGAERNQTAIEEALTELVTRRFSQHPSVKE